MRSQTAEYRKFAATHRILTSGTSAPINPARVIFEKNHLQEQGERNLGLPKLRRKRQKNTRAAERIYLGVEKSKIINVWVDF
jgi:hypothetical protein